MYGGGIIFVITKEEGIFCEEDRAGYGNSGVIFEELVREDEGGAAHRDVMRRLLELQVRWVLCDMVDMIIHKRRLLSISVLQAGFVLGALYALVSLIFAAIFLVFGLFGMVLGAASSDAVAVLGGSVGVIIFALLLPIVYGVMGLISGIVGAAAYNLIVKFTGGLVLSVGEES